MLLRLTRSIRIRIGWLVALAYLFCVLGPGAALALGTGPVPCLVDEIGGIPASMMYVHADGSLHGGKYMHHHADAGSPAQHHQHGKASPGPCCAMTCATALPADLPMIVKPSQSASICVSEAYRIARGEAPPLLYRPPIT
jgi:hypothetical protein